MTHTTSRSMDAPLGYVLDPAEWQILESLRLHLYGDGAHLSPDQRRDLANTLDALMRRAILLRGCAARRAPASLPLASVTPVSLTEIRDSIAMDDARFRDRAPDYCKVLWALLVLTGEELANLPL